MSIFMLFLTLNTSNMNVFSLIGLFGNFDLGIQAAKMEDSYN